MAKKYTVGSGDSWFSIAGELFSGPGVTKLMAQRFAEQLRAANPGAGLLHPGDVIKIPNIKTKDAKGNFIAPTVSFDFMVKSAQEEFNLFGDKAFFDQSKRDELAAQIAGGNIPDQNKANLLFELDKAGGFSLDGFDSGGTQPGTTGLGDRPGPESGVLPTIDGAEDPRLDPTSPDYDPAFSQQTSEAQIASNAVRRPASTATQRFKDKLAQGGDVSTRVPAPEVAPTLPQVPPASSTSLGVPSAAQAQDFAAQQQEFNAAQSIPLPEPPPLPEHPVDVLDVEKLAEEQAQEKADVAVSVLSGMDEEDVLNMMENTTESGTPLLFFGDPALQPGFNPEEYFPTPTSDGTMYVHVSQFAQLAVNERQFGEADPDFVLTFLSPQEAGVLIQPQGGRRKRGGGSFRPPTRSNPVGQQRYHTRIGYG